MTVSKQNICLKTYYILKICLIRDKKQGDKMVKKRVWRS